MRLKIKARDKEKEKKKIDDKWSRSKNERRIKERKYGGFRHISCHCRNQREIEENKRVEVGGPEHWPSSNKFKVLTSRMMQAEIPSKGKERKEKLLREVMVKIGLKQKDEEEGITVEALLDSGVTELVMSSEFVRKNKFKKKLDRPIYVRNVNSTFNHVEPIEHTVEVVLFYRRHKERTEIDVIGSQK